MNGLTHTLARRHAQCSRQATNVSLFNPSTSLKILCLLFGFQFGLEYVEFTVIVFLWKC